MPFTKKELLSYNTREPILTRLNRKSYIDDSGCQIYTGSLDRCGYGAFKVGGRSLGAHKVMYILTYGDYDQDKYEMLHSCHNPSCINPIHLSHGTHKQNLDAVISRGLLFGNGVGGRKIKDKSVLLGSGGCGYRVCAESDEVCLLFKLRKQGLTLEGLATLFIMGMFTKVTNGSILTVGFPFKVVRTISQHEAIDMQAKSTL